MDALFRPYLAGPDKKGLNLPANADLLQDNNKGALADLCGLLLMLRGYLEDPDLDRTVPEDFKFSSLTILLFEDSLARALDVLNLTAKQAFVWPDAGDVTNYMATTVKLIRAFGSKLSSARAQLAQLEEKLQAKDTPTDPALQALALKTAKKAIGTSTRPFDLCLNQVGLGFPAHARPPPGICQSKHFSTFNSAHASFPLSSPPPALATCHAAQPVDRSSGCS